MMIPLQRMLALLSVVLLLAACGADGDPVPPSGPEPAQQTTVA